MAAKTKKSILLFLFLFPAHLIFAQQTAPPRTDEIVRKARDEMWKYVETFRNLLSQETKTFEIYEKNGEVKKRRVVTSNFIVYQLSKDEKRIAEYRNVLAVDGKNLERTENRAQDFFEKIVKVESSAKELERLQEESQRYDEELLISGMTLFQSPILSDNLRPAFEFTLAGKEIIDGREIFVIDYRQVKATPYISIGLQPAAGDAKSSLSYDVEIEGLSNFNERVHGRLWIDANNFQIRREHREMTIQPEGFEDRIVFSENDFEYQKSDFGILTPKKITSLQYRIDRKKRASVKDVKVTFEYQKFTKPDVEVKSADVK